MLQFIVNSIPDYLPSTISFNTSHVVVYLTPISSTARSSLRFNTSHVVVYRGFDLVINHFLQFQYISCCSLSKKMEVSPYNKTEFQYISCCSLSSLHLPLRTRMRGFNTSHVVVYQKRNYKKIKIALFQYISCCSLSRYTSQQNCHKHSFNTSHVVVYPVYFIAYRCFRHVSIHLMLQFIHIFLRNRAMLQRFQYISCCSLSKHRQSKDGKGTVSIHLMLQFIKQYHLKSKLKKCFNTSHVVVYRRMSRHVFSASFLFQYISCCSLSSTGRSKKWECSVSIHLMLQFI